MSKGYLVIAQNNKKYDYLRMAYALALSIKNTQSSVKSITLATDSDTIPDAYRYVFDEIVEIPWGDSAKRSEWKIDNKWKYYYITPYEETIILDVDMIFTSDISYWWDILKDKDVWACSAPVTFKGHTITSDIYRQTFSSNSLPNVYTAFMYFKKSDLTSELFKMVDYIFKNWKLFYYEYLDITRPKNLSGDVAYALAIKLLGIESQCLDNISIPTFVHMKSQVQNLPSGVLDEDWTKSLPSYFLNDGSLIVGNYKQEYPFHYHIKEWLTDDKIKILENIYKND